MFVQSVERLQVCKYSEVFFRNMAVSWTGRWLALLPALTAHRESFGDSLID